MSLDETLANLARLCADPALAGVIRHKLTSYPEIGALFDASSAVRTNNTKPIPPFADITAAQASMFDNWRPTNGKRPKRGTKGHYRERYQATFDFWTLDVSKTTKIKRINADFCGMVQLLDKKALIAKLDELAKPNRIRSWNHDCGDPSHCPGVSDGCQLAAFGAFLREAAGDMPDDMFMGPIYSTAKGDGKHFHAWHYAVWTGADALVIYTNEGHFSFNKFSRTTTQGRPLATNCLGHDRRTNSKLLAPKWLANRLP